MYDVMEEKSTTRIWLNLEKIYMSKSLMNIYMKAVSTIWLLLVDEVMYDVMEKKSTTGIWLNLEKIYMSKSLMNILHLKKNLYKL